MNKIVLHPTKKQYKNLHKFIILYFYAVFIINKKNNKTAKLLLDIAITLKS